MFARIRHLAGHMERYDAMVKFYQTIFGMKQITTGLMDESSKANPERGHISDGVIGMALLAKRAGSGQGLDPFGFEVDSVEQPTEELADLATGFPECAAKTIAGGVQGAAIAKDLQACSIDKHAFANPDGMRVDISE